MGMLNTLVPQFLTIISEDGDREVVMATVDVIHDLLEKVGVAVLQVPDATDHILTRMKLIFMHKVGHASTFAPLSLTLQKWANDLQ